MRIIDSFAIASLLTVGFTAPSLAATIANGSFETPALSPGGAQGFAAGSSIGGWNVLGGGVVLLETTYSESAPNSINAFTAAEGFNSLDLTGSGNTGTDSGVEQAIATNAGEVYRLAFSVGAANGGPVYQTPSSLGLSIDSGSRIAFTNSTFSAGTVNWQSYFYDFTATSGSTSIAFLNSTLDNNFVGLDNVQISTISSAASVPEPFTIIGSIVGGSAAFRMRKKLKSNSTDKN
ncbi:DUF642 domain-containing protein [Chamaesiphon sp. OTE_20_metabat_361]|uniref:DUF642 domain-containing protein n=1 Tax=Chamaesiphon sp. OTE_20_metabat_361 TaxID=2964689 RepID=UPI00286B2726|nr:DUF642 domain-containing protein [Chamaesiphon sp. OTE_20_metabat_361]